MKIAIISDTHDNLYNLAKALDLYIKEKCDVLLHAGDMAQKETLEYLAMKFHGPLHVVEGNADTNPAELKDLTKIYPNLIFHGVVADITVDTLRIGMTHFPKIAQQLASEGIYDLVIHGHDHKPWQSFNGKTEILNPGNLQDSRYPATCALYDTSTRTAQLFQIARL